MLTWQSQMTNATRADGEPAHKGQTSAKFYFKIAMQWATFKIDTPVAVAALWYKDAAYDILMEQIVGLVAP